MDRRQSLLSAGGIDYRVPAVKYDGTNDYLAPDTDIQTASNVGLCSFWFRLDGGDGSAMELADGSLGIIAGDSFKIRRNTSNKMSFVWNIPFSTSNSFESSTSFITSSVWHHCMASWDSNVAQHLYIDGANELNSIESTGTQTPIGVENLFASDTASNKYDGAIAQFYLTDEYLDLSIAANRLKFYDSDVVDLGDDGSTPTGTQPLVLLNLPYNLVGNNLGSGTDFTIVGSPVNTYAP